MIRLTIRPAQLILVALWPLLLRMLFLGRLRFLCCGAHCEARLSCPVVLKQSLERLVIRAETKGLSRRRQC